MQEHALLCSTRVIGRGVHGDTAEEFIVLGGDFVEVVEVETQDIRRRLKRLSTRQEKSATRKTIDVEERCNGDSGIRW